MADVEPELEVVLHVYREIARGALLRAPCIRRELALCVAAPLKDVAEPSVL